MLLKLSPCPWAADLTLLTSLELAAAVSHHCAPALPQHRRTGFCVLVPWRLLVRPLLTNKITRAIIHGGLPGWNGSPNRVTSFLICSSCSLRTNASGSTHITKVRQFVLQFQFGVSPYVFASRNVSCYLVIFSLTKS